MTSRQDFDADKSTSFSSGCIVLPSLKVSGGVIESLRLGKDLKNLLGDATVVSMWNSERAVISDDLDCSSLSRWKTSIFWAPLQLFIIAFFFWRLARRNTNTAWVFTHYATLPLALLVPARQRFIFVQDLEWNFLGNVILKKLLRIIITRIYRRGKLLAANQYLLEELKLIGLTPLGLASIWADPFFLNTSSSARNIDVLVVLRKGSHKRLDLYISILHLFKNVSPNLRVAAISTDDELGALAQGLVSAFYIRPDREVIRNLYASSKIFLLLSEHEGFALPPLEAMGSGCVPVCRDSGGPRAYMVGALREWLLPLDTSIQSIGKQVITLVENPLLLGMLSQAAVDIFHQGLLQARSRQEILESVLARRGGRK